MGIDVENCMKLENGMSRDDLLHLLVTGEMCGQETGFARNLVYVVGLRPESGGTDIHHWLVTIRVGDNRKEIYVKTV
jgi:hypothetical protein